METYAIVEVGSNNTKTHIYKNKKLIYENNETIEFKKNYVKENKICLSDLLKLDNVLDKILVYTNNIYIYGCSIFRNISKIELNNINNTIYKKYKLKIEVVSQEDEALYTALGCYENIDYDKNICVFIGGGGSIELIFVKNRRIVETKYFDFGVVDITNKFPSLKDDIPKFPFEEVYRYVASLIGNIDIEAELLILAGGDHLYWYNNANFELLKNSLYYSDKQKYMLTDIMNDKYDTKAFSISLNEIKNRSDNPLWFDGARAMKVVTNLIAHKIKAKYIIPTRINMEDGIRNKIEKR